ncbi:MAG: hypothetical protein EOP09_07935 [Proteobacteria bacterium]|nr:MAG: hypothetical protein EOP09_07935 [Pseudomonadota bacterium]
MSELDINEAWQSLWLHVEQSGSKALRDAFAAVHDASTASASLATRSSEAILSAYFSVLPEHSAIEGDRDPMVMAAVIKNRYRGRYEENIQLRLGLERVSRMRGAAAIAAADILDGISKKGGAAIG